MTILFISDLHLSTTRPEKLALFKDFMTGPALQADVLYILGDLFEHFWIGIDDQRPPNPDVIACLKAYTAYDHTRLFFMRGNRDFHIDARFAEATGCELVDDPHLLQLDGETILLMHGDTLCTDDTDYQRWRRFISNPFIKWLNLRLPMSLRQKIATGVREYTVEATQQKPKEITDVNEDTVIETMRHYGVQTLVHGHTHRQAIHNVDLGNTGGKRIVLGDWYEQDCVLVKDDQGFRFERVADFIASEAS